MFAILDNDVLSPFSGDTPPGGVDLRPDPDGNNIYRRIRDYRDSAREAERQADVSGASHAEAMPHWRDVWDEGQSYLKTQAKDLEIVAYMIEAAPRLHQLKGFTDALILARQLIGEFWGELLPTPDEDGIETTIRPIERMNGDPITYPLQRIPVTEDTSAGEMLVWHFDRAKRIDGMADDERKERLAAGEFSTEMFNRAASETPVEFYVERMADLAAAREALAGLNDIFEEKVEEEEFVPNLSRFSDGLDLFESVLKQCAGDRLDEAMSEPEGEAETEGEAPASGGAAAPPPPKPAGAIESRDDALKMLEKVAVWFEKHEPQSILPAEIRKAIRRGKMTPTELYADLISDDSVLKNLYRDVGFATEES